MFQFLNQIKSSKEGNSVGFSITSIGKSYQGDPLQMVSFGLDSTSSSSGSKKKAKKKKKKKKKQKKSKKQKKKSKKEKKEEQLLTGRGGSKKKPLIWLDCQFHAREWIATPTCLYLIMQVSIN